MHLGRPALASLTAPLALALAGAVCGVALAAPPRGVVAEVVAEGIPGLAGVVPLQDGRVIAWERAGRLWLIDSDGHRHDKPMLDISDEVLAWRDHGLLGVALDPAFATNGHVYLAYVVDRHHLESFGGPNYDPAETITAVATIARITRYTADLDEGLSHIHAETRHVLLGETRADGIPIVHQSHGIGSLAFGEDGTLVVSVGDSADYATFDTGGQVPGGFVTDALANGILRPSEDVGAYRAQLRDSLNGKLLRIDPATGAGVPGNPWFDQLAPRAPRSRVFATGLRNPFRMSRIPGTGSHVPSAGNPGTFVISDVGWGTWEEVNVVARAGSNLGWPLYEGHDQHPGYAYLAPACTEAPNPLADAGCAPFFTFRDLVTQAQQGAVDWTNPCAGVQAENAEAQAADAQAVVGGFHGWGYRSIRASDGSRVAAWFDAPEGSTLFVRYANAGQAVECSVIVDDHEAVVLPLPPTGAWDRWQVAAVRLRNPGGAVRIELRGRGPSAPGDAPVAALVDSLVVPVDGDLPVIPRRTRNGAQVAPVIDWKHGEALARTLGWNAGAGVATPVGSEGGASGSPFGGSCAIACAPIPLPSWPAEWRNRIWLADFADGWLRAASLEGGVVTDIRPFDGLPGGIVGIFPAADGDSFYVAQFSGTLIRYSWSPSGNRAPKAVVTSSRPWGRTPLAVTFDASASSDPEDGDRVRIEWTFDDGSPRASGRVVTHVFSGTGEPSLHHVLLTVIDSEGATDEIDIPVWGDNSPPTARISSLQTGQVYPLDVESVLPLKAEVKDEETPGQWTCRWQVTLHHNTHSHPEPPDDRCDSTMVTSPLGCGDDHYWMTVDLTVTDPLGLSATDSVRLDPDCTGILACRADVNGDRRVDGLDLTILLQSWGMPASQRWQVDLDGDGMIGGSDLSLLLNHWGPCPEP
jgi:glucose/arabinose dehydrogenase